MQLTPRRLALAMVACLALIGSDVAAAAKPVTVMTRNIYLGGDITRPLTATQGLSGLPALIAFGTANDALRDVVDQTDFPARAQLLAAEIARRDPDLIGLQEVALWRSGPLQLPPDPGFAQPNATQVDYDFLEILLAALRDRGLRYAVVDVQTESDVEGPAFPSFPPAAGARDERLTMRDVLLKRQSSDIKIEDSGGAQYAARVPFTLGGAQFEFIRGYNWADVRAGSRRLRFINTHLESQSSLVALLQARELLAGPASVSGRPVVMAGDFNSDPEDASTKPTDPVPVPHFAAYREITGPGAFADAWLQFAPAADGFTSGLSETVDDADLSSIDHRIDFIFGRAAGGGPLPVDRAWIVGDAARTSSGLRASDHMGVVVRLRP